MLTNEAKIVLTLIILLVMTFVVGPTIEGMIG